MENEILYSICQLYSDNITKKDCLYLKWAIIEEYQLVNCIQSVTGCFIDDFKSITPSGLPIYRDIDGYVIDIYALLSQYDMEMVKKSIQFYNQNKLILDRINKLKLIKEEIKSKMDENIYSELEYGIKEMYLVNNRDKSLRKGLKK